MLEHINDSILNILRNKGMKLGHSLMSRLRDCATEARLGQINPVIFILAILALVITLPFFISSVSFGLPLAILLLPILIPVFVIGAIVFVLVALPVLVLVFSFAILLYVVGTIINILFLIFG